ncbi:hypothetical protein BDQ12DRAFT_632279 [Crucibulum laeve]|uniref:Extracellular membrane protein CFEM domain-containing protein n=1 Tax=Crucibulum laeve TaxID=68775 RepID=A0A5C3M937_9AGAR|nr:hypothetical protein BDQ12DRAFT_632279 [Crucibulum laeve]
MFTILPLLALFCALAGRVLAFNITVGTRNLAATQLLDIPDSPVKTACNTNITAANQKIQACNDDTPCLCTNDTAAALLDAETCMFHFLINTKSQAPDFRAGSTPVLAAYSAACASANIKLAPAQTALQLPSTWDGPFVAILPTGGAIVTVIVGGMLGISALLILSNL